MAVGAILRKLAGTHLGLAHSVGTSSDGIFISLRATT